jgi:hypothetical protein
MEKEIMATTLNDVKTALPKLDWKLDKDLIAVTYYLNGKKTDDNVISVLLESVSLDITVGQLADLIRSAARNKSNEAQGEVVFLNLPLLESKLDAESDLTELDDSIWADLKFVEGDTSKFYVKDPEVDTYTAYLSSSTASDKSEVKTLREAYYKHLSNRPEQILKALVQSINNAKVDFDEALKRVPATAWQFLKIRAFKRGSDYAWDRLVVPSGSSDDLYKGFFSYEAEFRTNGNHLIDPPANLTNDPNKPAIAYIDLKALDKKYSGKSSKLWDEFLLQRLHKPEYVSIFKAWTYAVAVGQNNSRQEMWLYGNGGTGKSCLCKSFIRGFNKLARKDICLAASKDTGKSNFNSELLNKHLLVYSDAKNLRGGMSEFKHNATGGDNVRIEGKGKDATYGEIYLKCLTCSNELPKVDMTDRSQSSRCIVLPFSLDDSEMKQYGLMDDAGQLIGSATFQTQLDAEFDCFLASCKEHYIKRCPRDSNIDAHEALDELSAIELDEINVIEEFVDSFFEITTDITNRVSQKEFRTKCLAGCEETDPETGVKIYKDVNLESVRNYLEKKYDFRWKVVKISGKPVKAVASTKVGIKIKSQSAVTVAATEDVF